MVVFKAVLPAALVVAAATEFQTDNDRGGDMPLPSDLLTDAEAITGCCTGSGVGTDIFFIGVLIKIFLDEMWVSVTKKICASNRAKQNLVVIEHSTQTQINTTQIFL